MTTALVLVAAYAAVSAVLILLGLLMTDVLVSGSVGRWDDSLNTWAAAHRGSPWNQLSADATFLANTPGIVVVAAAASAVVAFVKRSRWALLLLFGLAVELTGFLTVNYVVSRPRPSVAHLGSTPSTFSWPSGHVAATVVLYGGIAVLVAHLTQRVLPNVLARIVAVGLTVAVAASRVYRGEHHLTDVLAGLVLGACALTAAWYALGPLRVRTADVP